MKHIEIYTNPCSETWFLAVVKFDFSKRIKMNVLQGVTHVI